MTITTSMIGTITSVTSVKTTEEIIADQIQDMVEEAQEQMQSMIDAMTDAQEEEGIQVDGISSGFAEPEPSEKEFQDQTAVEADIDTIDDLHDLSMSALRPEIIAKFVGPAYHDSRSGEGIGSYKFNDLLEANILRDQLSDDVYKKLYTLFSENEPEILEKATSRVDEVFEKLETEVASLSSYRSMINEALSALDLQECGTEIGQLIVESVQEVLQDEDTVVEKLPSDLEELIMESINSNKSSDTHFSNTKLYFCILASIYSKLTGYGSHMGSQYDVGKPFEFRMRARTKYSSKAFKEKQAAQTASLSASVIQAGPKGFVSAMRRSSAASEIQQLLCCLSNELIISGGINRLRGTELGNKYGVTTDDPFNVVFGMDMGSLYSSNYSKITDLDTRTGSLTDFITVEDTDSSRTVLPFELNDVVISGQNYLAGSKYMVEGPARKIDKSFSNPLGAFTENFSGEITSAAAYFTEIMGLDESTLLAPQGLLVRILEDIQKLCLEGSKPSDSMDRNVIKSAVKVAQSNPGRWHNPPGRVNRYFFDSGDILMLVDRTLSEEEQPEYRLSVHETISSGIGTRISSTFGTRHSFETTVTTGYRAAVRNRTHILSLNGKVLVPIGNNSSAKYEIDQEGEVNNVHKMILTVTDEILAEAHSFASRGGASASYKNDQGFTQYSGLDYSAVLSTVYYLYHFLLRDLFYYKGYRCTGASPAYKTLIEVLTDDNKKTADALSAILSTYKEGGDFEDLFDDEQNSLAVEGLTSTTKIGKTLTMGKVVDIIDSLKTHRSLLKCEISALSAVASNILQKSMPLTQFQQEASAVFTGSTKLENVKNETLSAFVGLVNEPIGKDALRGLTSMQANNTALSLMRMSPADELEKRQKRFVATPGLIEALRVASESKILRRYEGIVCVGLPNGMVDNLRMAVASEDIRKNESSDLGKLSIRFTRDSELYSSIEFRDAEVSFDSSLYLAPGAYDGVRTDEEEEDTNSKNKNPDPVRDMINKVVFTRMESGNILEQLTGEEIIADGDEQTYAVLKNHVFSDLIRISIDFAMGVDIHAADLKKYAALNSAHVSSEGLSLLESVTKSSKVSMLSSSASIIKNVMTSMTIDEKTNFYELRTGYSGQQAFRKMTSHDVTDIKRAGQSTLYTAELDRHRILGTSTFDRVFYVPISSTMFRLDYREGDYQERRRWRYGRLSSRNFDLSGYVCDVRVT